MKWNLHLEIHCQQRKCLSVSVLSLAAISDIFLLNSENFAAPNPNGSGKMSSPLHEQTQVLQTWFSYMRGGGILLPKFILISRFQVCFRGASRHLALQSGKSYDMLECYPVLSLDGISSDLIPISFWMLTIPWTFKAQSQGNLREFEGNVRECW